VLDVGEVRRVALAVIDDARSLTQKLPCICVTHHGEAQNDLGVVEKEILPENADARARRDRHGSFARLFVTGKNLEEGRLAGPVCADQAVARAGIELERDTREERACTKGFTELRSSNHPSRREPTTSASCG